MAMMPDVLPSGGNKPTNGPIAQRLADMESSVSELSREINELNAGLDRLIELNRQLECLRDKRERRAGKASRLNAIVFVVLFVTLVIVAAIFLVRAAFAAPFLVSDPAQPLEGFNGDWTVIRCVYQQGNLDAKGIWQPGAAPVVNALQPDHSCRFDMAGVPYQNYILEVWFGDIGSTCCATPDCTGFPKCPNGPYSAFPPKPASPLAPTGATIK